MKKTTNQDYASILDANKTFLELGLTEAASIQPEQQIAILNDAKKRATTEYDQIYGTKSKEANVNADDHKTRENAALEWLRERDMSGMTPIKLAAIIQLMFDNEYSKRYLNIKFANLVGCGMQLQHTLYHIPANIRDKDLGDRATAKPELTSLACYVASCLSNANKSRINRDSDKLSQDQKERQDQIYATKFKMYHFALNGKVYNQGSLNANPIVISNQLTPIIRHLLYSTVQKSNELQTILEKKDNLKLDEVCKKAYEDSAGKGKTFELYKKIYMHLIYAESQAVFTKPPAPDQKVADCISFYKLLVGETKTVDETVTFITTKE